MQKSLHKFWFASGNSLLILSYNCQVKVCDHDLVKKVELHNYVKSKYGWLFEISQVVLYISVFINLKSGYLIILLSSLHSPHEFNPFMANDVTKTRPCNIQIYVKL